MSSPSQARLEQPGAAATPGTGLSLFRGSDRERQYAFGSRKPNLFVIGAMKSGTTYLNKSLGAHPAIFMCSPEEPSYFLDPKQLRTLWPDAWDQGFWRGEEHYLDLFRSHGDAAYLGESSTSYTKRPLVSGVPERIHAFNPDARFIYLLRDPIERTISHYWHMVRFHAERRPILEAIRTEPQYLDVSHYAMQLAPYIERFGRDSVAILTFEQLTRAPAATMRTLYRWLGVDCTLVNDSEFSQPENVTPNVLRMAAWHGVFQRLRRSRPFRVIVPLMPRMVRRYGVRLATRNVHRDTVDTSDVVAFLRPIQRRQTEALVDVVGREFPEWTTLYGNDVTP